MERLGNLYGIQILFLLVGLYSGMRCKENSTSKNQLHKVYHHQMVSDASASSAQPSIELGSLVCYFSAAPMINSLSKAQKNKSQEDLIFFFPKASIASSEAKDAIKKLHAAGKLAYKIRFEEVAVPTQGIKLHLSFDPQKVSMKYDLFDSIGLQKGVVFRFFNQQVLKDLNNKCSKPVLNMACAKKPAHIVVDCGHGGTDFGTVGIAQYSEKQVTLNVGLELARLLKNQGFKVLLTRAADVDVSLDERTTMANKKNADLFVSIHANNASGKQAQGIETFWMDCGLLTEGSSTLDSECKTLACLVEKQRCAASNQLAHTIHKQVLAAVHREHTIIDRSVRKSVSQVLLGSAMPAVLIEVGFLSNSYEANLLSQERYQKLLAQGICNGVLSYTNQII